MSRSIMHLRQRAPRAADAAFALAGGLRCRREPLSLALAARRTCWSSRKVPAVFRVPRVPAVALLSRVCSRGAVCMPRMALSTTAADQDRPEEVADLADLKNFVRSKASTGGVRKIFSALSDAEAGVGPFANVDADGDVYRLAVKSLIRHARTDLALDLYKLRVEAKGERPALLPPDLPLAAAVLRAIIRNTKKRKQLALDTTFLYEDIKTQVSEVASNSQTVSPAESASAIASIICSLLDRDRVEESSLRRATSMFKVLVVLSRSAGSAAGISVAEYNKCMRLLGKRRCLDGVFAILDCMHACGVERDNETFEFLANAVVRQVEFVTGAVSMDTLPVPLPSEVAFVGRSNVGKSSLVNMICNRKALAYVSGRPGKTQQFNYFIVNKDAAKSSFYFVDLPGVGYARVAKSVQASWLRFMQQYLSSRPSLRVVFHLIDGRHGAFGDDELLMKLISECGFEGQYVLVLTKMDKVDKQRAKLSTLDRTRSMLAKSGCSADTPIILTSASSKLGRDEMWRFLRRALDL